MRLLSAQARAIIPPMILPTLPNEAYALAQVIKEYALVAQANARQAMLEHDMQTGATQSRYAAIFNAEYQRLMSSAMPPLKEAGPSVAWVPGTVTAAMPAAVVTPGGKRTADIKGGGILRVALPGASKTDPSGTTASGQEVVTTVSTPTDDAVAQAAVDQQVAASASWLDTTAGQLAVGALVAAALYYGVKYAGSTGASRLSASQLTYVRNRRR